MNIILHQPSSTPTWKKFYMSLQKKQYLDIHGRVFKNSPMGTRESDTPWEKGLKCHELFF